MSAPRLDIDLAKVTHNARQLVARLGAVGIRTTGVTKASLGSPAVARALLDGGATGLGDSRVENLERLAGSDVDAPFTLIRSPMLSQVSRVVQVADVSLNTSPAVLTALSAAAGAHGVVHAVVLMVELGDLREGVAADEVADLARWADALPALRVAGVGTNLACQSGVVPDQANMVALSTAAEQVEAVLGRRLEIVSGGNSANLEWALSTADVVRVDELRLGESILLGTEPLHRRRLDDLHTDAFTLVAEVIEAGCKPSRPWGTFAQTAFDTAAPLRPPGTVRQVIVALGRQDVDPTGLVPPPGTTVLGASSDHLVLDAGDHDLDVGDELEFQLDYRALLQAMTSPFVTKVTR